MYFFYLKGMYFLNISFHFSYVGSTLINSFGLQLGRITGLDPAEPHFEHTHRKVRLDETDAFYVDVIHTDANPLMSLGMYVYFRLVYFRLAYFRLVYILFIHIFMLVYNLHIFIFLVQ